MSIDIPSVDSPSLDRPGRIRRRPRDHPPEPLLGPPNVNYPDCDGRAMADNTLQDDWMDTIKGGLTVLFRDDPDVFVASNLMWYPVEGRNRRRLAPDAMVIFGRPKGYRGSYIQHREAGIPPQVVFEIWSPGNRRRVMDYKRQFYERHGVEEYYLFEPYKIQLDGWISEGGAFQPIAQTSGWVSPRLGIRFELGEDLTIFGPDGRPFVSFEENDRQRVQSEQAARRETDRADREAESARQAIELADREAESARQAIELADRERFRSERLAAQLRALGMEPEA